MTRSEVQELFDKRAYDIAHQEDEYTVYFNGYFFEFHVHGTFVEVYELNEDSTEPNYYEPYQIIEFDELTKDEFITQLDSL